jgi:hypothetical protein
VKRAIVIVGLVIAAFGAVCVRVVLEGRGAVAEGDAAIVAKHTDDAIAAWEAAARWYLPFAPHVDDAYARLTALANAEPEHALSAWRAIRRAATATRSLWQPHADDLAAANAAIAKLSAAHPDGAHAAGGNVAERTAFHAARLAGELRPSKGAAALAILGILSWLAGIGVVAVRGIDKAGGLVRRATLVGVGLTAFGLVAWAAGLYNA